MNMLRTQIALLGLMLLAMSLARGTVLACTDPSWFTLDELPETDLLVRATIVATDYRKVNAVLRVDEYFKGEGPQYLPVVRYPVALATGSILRGYHTGCLYSGSGYHRWRQGLWGYFGLKSNGDGTFTDFIGGTAHFYVRDGYMFDHWSAGAEPELTQTYGKKHVVMTESEFVALLLREGERDAALVMDPFAEARHPLMRFLMFETERGTRYQLNPDRSVIRLADDAPIAISPDGAHVAVRIDSETIRFQDIWLDDAYYSGWFADRPQVLVSGSDVLFTKNSNLAAVWDDKQITVYMFHDTFNSNLGAGGSGMGMNIYEIASMQLTECDEPVAVTWSDDSSTIAWQDHDKIWRWNLFDQAEPQLMRTVTQPKTERLLDLSRTGRFARIGSPAGWTLIDSRTGESYENAVVSPNEQFLGFFNSDLPESMTSWDDGLRQNEACKPPLRTTCATLQWQLPDSVEIHVFSHELEMLGTFSCTEDGRCDVGPSSWDPARDPVLGRWRYIRKWTDSLRQVVFDSLYRQVAVLRGDYQIEFDFYYGGYFTGALETDVDKLDFVNLEDILDSPIASIEWGQPIFYDTFMLTATEYLPHSVTFSSRDYGSQDDA